MSIPSQRIRVLQLYKTLMYMSKDYPAGENYFKEKVRSSFLKNSTLKDESEIEKKIELGNYVIKELEALYSLKKYRTLKQRYYEPLGKNWGYV